LSDKPYLQDLSELEAFAETLPNTRMMAIAKVTTLAVMNMRWERIMVDREFPEDPWPHAHRLVQDARNQLAAWAEAGFIEGPSEPLGKPSEQMEERHHDLFQTLWVNFTEADYEDRIARYTHRLEINDLAGGFFDGKSVIDFGCGHGNFLHACLRAGAGRGLGIDYGEESIRYSIAARDRLGVPSESLDFRVASVYDSGEPGESWDVALQNGVFHHLDDEDAAYREVHRVLKPGGWFWVYTDGAGAVSHDLWDASVRILREVPYDAVLEVLDFMGVETNKRYHLGDGLNAVYRHTGYDDFIARLEGYGFGNPRRLTGGFPTDFDHDVIDADPWGRQKFGDGDIRVLVQKL
jgi:SAM-dependent methyltransferase